MSQKEKLVQLAYEAFCNETGFQTRWEHLPETWREGWRKAHACAIQTQTVTATATDGGAQ